MSYNKTILDHRQIAKILPHRYPFLLVDKVIHIDLEKGEIIGQKNVTINEYFFNGHFPKVPIMPGVLVIEAMAQTGGILVHQKGYVEKTAVLLNISNAKFRRPIFPGDIINLEIIAVHISGKGGKIKAKAKVLEKIAVEAELSFALIEKEKL
ncbi:MAG: 3-hydroxyacyl-[acyl-carrier-protein] dehydratase FabZ [Candidatus Anoxychlamydiales bacterium]|nr:3-hydroxyacyl-[acyl-carrier-protein] dehydratase FabZ [Candidatus Anoxychlamydiales bacterium]